MLNTDPRMWELEEMDLSAAVAADAREAGEDFSSDEVF